MDRPLPIYASTASRRGRGRRRRRQWLRGAWPGVAGVLATLVVLLAVGAERLG
jgi:hypothetical protein